jgi:hypothetical protein
VTELDARTNRYRDRFVDQTQRPRRWFPKRR